MLSIATAIAEALETVDRPGGFAAGGLCDLLAPGLEVEGVGPIALPLLPLQAEQLIAAAERAPFGRGAETLVDTAVRRTWQIAPDRVHISGRGWSRTLAEIVRRVAEGLGVAGPVDAAFYKLLLYDVGGFFVSHRDTEKVAGMFGTLVVVLPSPSVGGELIVRHGVHETRFDLACPDPSQAAFAAFFADCPHEVLPVTAGCRLTLVYNLVRGAVGDPPMPPDYDAERGRLSRLLRRWGEEPDAVAFWPDKIVYPLEHAYTPAGLSFAELKGSDSARAASLAAAAGDADCDLHLALLSIAESGSADHTGGGSYRWGRDDEDEAFEVVEVHDRSMTLSDWRRPDGTLADLGALVAEESEASPPDAFDDLEPDDESFREATGNEGASFERTYRKAALVVWPKRRWFAVLNAGGFTVTLPVLADLVTRWADAGATETSPLRAQAHDLSGHMIASWPQGRRYRTATQPSELTEILDLLVRLGDRARIEQTLANVAGEGSFATADIDAMLAAIRVLPPVRAADLVLRLVTATARRRFSDAAALLAKAAQGAAGLAPGDLRPAAEGLLAALPGDPARDSSRDEWGRPRTMTTEAVVEAMAALDRIDPAGADIAAATVLDWPAVYGRDAILVPAALAIAQRSVPGSQAFARLRDAALAHLGARIALPLSPPADWARDDALGCPCAKCRDLGAFLQDPVRHTWTLKASEPDRAHIELMVDRAKTDVACSTLRQGRPYTLVCTKTQASYDRRARQRAEDLDAVARIEGRGD